MEMHRRTVAMEKAGLQRKTSALLAWALRTANAGYGRGERLWRGSMPSDSDARICFWSKSLIRWVTEPRSSVGEHHSRKLLRLKIQLEVAQEGQLR
mmetsp:Transcript_102515/g.258274  ORF Transcript_102515/g.258274 Transcript_102515/m.258274 type:complete len:96 (+) Transcript_102515:197-484(+)